MLSIVASTFSAVSSATSAFSWRYVMLLTVTTATQRVLLATIAVAACVVVCQALHRFYRLWKVLRPMAGPPDWFPPLFNVNCLRAAARYRGIFNTSTVPPPRNVTQQRNFFSERYRKEVSRKRHEHGIFLEAQDSELV
ncbi:hypothetical protein V5799_029811 [Amblyomma americanum]|uniref:Uncharacterized protein n=1 Tax=Amblyomma americanum TaxID=6943 RepID=A0AAQ4EPY8_AMBAM